MPVSADREKWMLDQFNSAHVQAHLKGDDWTSARGAFEAALGRNLLTFY